MTNGTQTQRESDIITTGDVLALQKLLVERYVSGRAFSIEDLEGKNPSRDEVKREIEHRMAPVYRAWTTLIGELCDAKVASVHPNGRGMSFRPVELTPEQTRMYQDTKYALRQVDSTIVF